MHAKKELIGASMSTYSRWAGFLGNAGRVRRCYVDSPDTRFRRGQNPEMDAPAFERVNFSHPFLTHRLSLELYESEALQKSGLPRAPEILPVGNPFVENHTVDAAHPVQNT